jgi:hypothetical protein
VYTNLSQSTLSVKLLYFEIKFEFRLVAMKNIAWEWVEGGERRSKEESAQCVLGMI